MKKTHENSTLKLTSATSIKIVQLMSNDINNTSSNTLRHAEAHGRNADRAVSQTCGQNGYPEGDGLKSQIKGDLSLPQGKNPK